MDGWTERDEGRWEVQREEKVNKELPCDFNRVCFFSLEVKMNTERR